MLTKKPLLYCISHSSRLVFQYCLEASKGSRKEKHILSRHLLIATVNPAVLLSSIYSLPPQCNVVF